MKRLYRSKTNRKIAGICGGMAEYFELDPVLMRMLWLSFIIMGALVYVLGWIIIPENPSSETTLPDYKIFARSSQHKVLGGVCGGLGDYFNMDPVIIRILFLLMIFGLGW